MGCAALVPPQHGGRGQFNPHFFLTASKARNLKFESLYGKIQKKLAELSICLSAEAFFHNFENLFSEFKMVIAQSIIAQIKSDF